VINDLLSQNIFNNLSFCVCCFVEFSGGQQKRFSLAVELVDDPSIIFLDEPTTGLDSSSSVQCIQWLKQLAQEGRTIICTIHTPSARIFKMFDLIYALADGRVIYQGTSHNLIPFLKELDLPCPETFTPSDFLSEIAHDDYGPQNHRLTKKILNGMNKNYRLNTNREIILSSKLQDQITYENENNQQTVFSSSFLTQVCQLIKRNQLFNRRDTSFMLVRLTVHCFVGILVGLLYNGIGNDAKRIINIFKNVYVSFNHQL
jgi:ATP-binding cassette, subfamily G (WHITE), member 1